MTLACVHSGLPGAAQSPSHALTVNERLAKENEEFTKDGRKKWEAHQFSDALKSYLQALDAAERAGDLDHQAKAWMSICSCKSHLARYREAAQACENSHSLGLKAGNNTWAGGAASSLASIYRSLGEYSQSEREALEAVGLLKDSPRKDFLALALLYLADLAIEQGRFGEGISYADRAIAATRQAHVPEQEAASWDILGFALLNANKLDEAEKALRQGLAVQVNGKNNGWLSVILGHQSELELKRGNYAAALRLNDSAYASHSIEFSAVPAYYFVHIRGRILLGLNRKAEALAEFRRAVDLTNTWREGAVPGDNTNTQTAVYLNEVYKDYAELAADLALEHHDPELARRGLEVLAENRAASLREQLTAALLADPGFSNRYFELISELKASQAQVTLGHNPTGDTAKLQSIRLELSELEDQSLSPRTKKENYHFQNSLKDIQARLHQSEVLLSFCLGKNRSFLWAVTVNDVELYELSREAEIEQRAKRVSEALQNGHVDDSAESGLSRALFGPVSKKVWQKRDWLITEDGLAAGQVPYAALNDVSTSGNPQRLIAHHSLRVLPSELLLLLPDTARPQRRFVGVADPIYNLADSRHAPDVRLVHTAETQATVLGRLPGSEREVKAAAKLSGMPEQQILSGTEANEAALKQALHKTPELLHFAVHVVSPNGKPQEAALALSLGSGNMPELLTREAIAGYRVPGSLVILSGCASGQGKALPSAGLIGLSRAWLLAGASAVVVSAWPIPDDSGEFFSAFYDHLQRTVAGSLAQRAATALQEAQLDMQRGGGYRSSPSFWAAYSILSKE